MSGPWEDYAAPAAAAPVAGPWQDYSNTPRTAGGLYHYKDREGNDVYSKNPPPTDTVPVIHHGGGRVPMVEQEPVALPPTPASPANVPAYENIAAGGGHAVYQAGRALRQIYNNYLGSPSDITSTQDDIDQAKATDAPLMNTYAGPIGDIGTKIGAAAFATPASLLGMGAAGAGMGALDPVATGDPSRTENMVRGGLASMAGGAVAKTIGAVARPFANALGSHEQSAVDTLMNAGVPLNVAERTGSPFLQRLASGLRDSPVAAGVAAASDDASKAGLTRALIKTMGEDAPAATQPVMAAAKSRIGSVFDDVASRNPVHLDTQMAGDLQSVLADAKSSMTDAEFQVVQNHVNNVISAAARNGGQIDGAAFQKLYSTFGKITSSPQYGTAARDLREAMQNGLIRSASDPADVTALQTAREQYQAMKQIEGALSSDGSGEISVKKLANSLMTKSNRSQSVYGNGSQDVVDLAQSGKTILGDRLANSGTPARLQAGMMPSIGTEVGARVLSGEPMSAAKILAAGLAPKYAAPLVFSQGRLGSYLSNGVGDELTQALLKSGTTRLGRTATTVALPEYLRLARSLGSIDQNAP